MAKTYWFGDSNLNTLNNKLQNYIATHKEECQNCLNKIEVLRNSTPVKDLIDKIISELGTLSYDNFYVHSDFVRLFKRGQRHENLLEKIISFSELNIAKIPNQLTFTAFVQLIAEEIKNRLGLVFQIETSVYGYGDGSYWQNKDFKWNEHKDAYVKNVFIDGHVLAQQLQEQKNMYLYISTEERKGIFDSRHTSLTRAGYEYAIQVTSSLFRDDRAVYYRLNKTKTEWLSGDVDGGYASVLLSCPKLIEQEAKAKFTW